MLRTTLARSKPPAPSLPGPGLPAVPLQPSPPDAVATDATASGEGVAAATSESVAGTATGTAAGGVDDDDACVEGGPVPEHDAATGSLGLVEAREVVASSRTRCASSCSPAAVRQTASSSALLSVWR